MYKRVQKCRPLLWDATYTTPMQTAAEAASCRREASGGAHHQVRDGVHHLRVRQARHDDGLQRLAVLHAQQRCVLHHLPRRASLLG